MKIKSSQSYYNDSDAITSLDFFIIRKRFYGKEDLKRNKSTTYNHKER